MLDSNLIAWKGIKMSLRKKTIAPRTRSFKNTYSRHLTIKENPIAKRSDFIIRHRQEGSPLFPLKKPFAYTLTGITLLIKNPYLRRSVPGQ